MRAPVRTGGRYRSAPPRHSGWLVSYDVKSGARVRYLVAPDQASFHFTQSPDRLSFAGDGGEGGKWISVFTRRLLAKPQPGLVPLGVLETRRLASLARHDYILEPNEHFTPDGRWIIYRTNLEGASAIYAVSTGADPLLGQSAVPSSIRVVPR